MKGKAGLRALVIAILFVVCLVPGIARAADVTVGCPGGSGGTYPSINAALAATGQTGPNSYTVTGTCNENVALNNARSLTIVAGPAGAKIVGPQDADAFDISLSQDIALVNLDISGVPGSSVNTAGAGVAITDASEVHLIGCNVHDNQGGGVGVDTGSLLFLQGTTIQNNSPGDALDVTNNSSADVVGTTLQNNGFGVFVLNRSSVVFRRRNLIASNGDGAIQAADLSDVRFQTGDPALFTTIQGHNVNGIVTARQSVLILSGGPHLIQNNGSACPADPTCGGILALRNSTVRLFMGNISGNQGSGISVEQGVDLVMNNATVSNNSGDGVHIQRISIGDIGTGNSITGNGGASVFCDQRSLVIGDLSGFFKVRCEDIEGPGGHRNGEDNKEKSGHDK